MGRLGQFNLPTILDPSTSLPIYGPPLPTPPAGQQWVFSPQGKIIASEPVQAASWLDQELIAGVKNLWLLAGGGGLLLLLMARKRRR